MLSQAYMSIELIATISIGVVIGNALCLGALKAYVWLSSLDD